MNDDDGPVEKEESPVIRGICVVCGAEEARMEAEAREIALGLHDGPIRLMDMLGPYTCPACLAKRVDSDAC